MRGKSLVAAALVVSGCAPGARVTPLQAPTPPAQKADARDVLVHHCGRCHRSDLPTALPGALAVFDLTDDLWYAGLSQEQLDSALWRLRNLEDLDPRDLAVMEAFVTSAKPE